MAVAAEPFEATLDGLCADAFHRLGEAVRDRRAAFHTPVLVTIGTDGWPAARTVVLRHFDAGDRALRFHTDRRAGKVADLEASPRAAVHLYDPAAKLQFRLSGTATIHRDDPLAAEAWAATRLFSRRCYLADPAPGTTAGEPVSGLPAEFRSRAPEAAESEQGFVNFAVVRFCFDRLDWLYLSATGNRRAGFSWDATGRRSATWRVP